MIGIVAGALAGYGIGRMTMNVSPGMRLPGLLPVLSAAAVLGGAALVALLMPAARAARVDVLQALRSE